MRIGTKWNGAPLCESAPMALHALITAYAHRIVLLPRREEAALAAEEEDRQWREEQKRKRSVK